MKFYLIESCPLNQDGEKYKGDLVVTVEKACELLSVSKRTFYRHLEKGMSKGFKISEYEQPDFRVINMKLDK